MSGYDMVQVTHKGEDRGGASSEAGSEAGSEEDSRNGSAIGSASGSGSGSSGGASSGGVSSGGVSRSASGAAGELPRAVIVGVPLGDPRLSQPTALEAAPTGVGKPKRNTFACTNCHSQKSKCVPSDVNDIYRKPCVRCHKRGKLCKFDLSRRTRRRRRESDTSIEAHGSRGSPQYLAPTVDRLAAEPVAAHPPLPPLSLAPLPAPAPKPPAQAGAVSLVANESKRRHVRSSLQRELQLLLASQRENLNAVSDRLTQLSEKWNDVIENSVGVPLALDPVTLGIITREEAQLRLDLYRSDISNKFRLPFVKISADLELDEFREKEPILFVTIMATVSLMLRSGQSNDDQNMKLDNFALGLISHHMMRLGDKSFELLKSLLTLCLWYNFPEWSNRTRFHFFNYICCCLIRDLIPVKRPRLFSMLNNKALPAEDESAVVEQFLFQNESFARLVILVYVSALNINIFLRQPVQNRWGSLQDTASRIILLFESGPHSLYQREEDEILLTFAKLNRILEAVHIKLHEAEDEHLYWHEGLVPNAQLNLISKLQIELQVVYNEIPPGRARALAFFHSVEAYLHEWLFSRFMAKFPDHSVIRELPPEVSESFGKFAQSCISAMHEFLKLTPELIASLPLFHISRVVYTVGMLLLRVRYTTMTVPAFAFFKQSTQSALPLVKQISHMLNESAALFPYNNFLSKLRYVVALFVQIYANKIKAFFEDPKAYSESPCRVPINSILTPTPPQNSVPMLLNPVSPPGSRSPVSGVPVPEAGQPGSEVSNDLIDDLSFQLADLSSLEYGFNALNDEFWTDVFFGVM
ncbi:LAQU0S01e00298g1_1 [Lachancea quebecensis]|uniref:LAQU0S01e00298g1_1 n=1 Tax=Lachancea quebecensis TaxID=1654605 RepID=A0A0P1KLI2_9SACH|nr:LAQU0S01e00298g1_1 [Lachancea quebecensis]